jgi:hypothetical protein
LYIQKFVYTIMISGTPAVARNLDDATRPNGASALGRVVVAVDYGRLVAVRWSVVSMRARARARPLGDRR